jgi:Calponin homology (CH) domain/LIM domain
LLFSPRWGDGLAFCALIHRFTGKIDFDKLDPKAKEPNMELAFEVAGKLGVPQLLDPEDMLIARPEPLSVCTYVAQLYHILPQHSKAAGKAPGVQMRPVGGLGGITESSSSSPASRPTTSTASSSSPSSSSKKPAPKVPAKPAPQCSKCHKALSGETMEMQSPATKKKLQFHKTCFKCSKCSKQLDKRPVLVREQPYCESCGRQVYVETQVRQRTGTLKYCPKCKKPATAKFCSTCGTGTTEPPKDAQKSAATVECSQCHLANPVGSKFCSKCGGSVGAEAPATAAKKPPAVPQKGGMGRGSPEKPSSSSSSSSSSSAPKGGMGRGMGMGMGRGRGRGMGNIGALAGKLNFPAGMAMGGPPHVRASGARDEGDSNNAAAPSIPPKKLEHLTKSRPQGVKGRAAPTLRRRKRELRTLEKQEAEKITAQEEKRAAELAEIEARRAERAAELERVNCPNAPNRFRKTFFFPFRLKRPLTPFSSSLFFFLFFFLFFLSFFSLKKDPRGREGEARGGGAGAQARSR